MGKLSLAGCILCICSILSRRRDYKDSESEEYYDEYDEYDYEYEYYNDGPFECVEPEGGLVLKRDQTIKNPSSYFNGVMAEYEAGFGDCSEEYFIGLDQLNAITSSGRWHLTVVIGDKDGTRYSVKYTDFSVGPAPGYKLRVGGFQKLSGSMGDSLSYHNGMDFSASDNDKDTAASVNCAEKKEGGWWFKDCYEANFMAPFGSYSYMGVTWKSHGIPDKDFWYHWSYGAWYLNSA